MADAPAPAAADSALAPPLEQLRRLAAELRLLLPGVQDGEAGEPTEEFNREVFWRRLNEAAEKVSWEATTLTTAFSRAPLPSPQEVQRICEQVYAAIKVIIAVYSSLPKDQGTTLRKLVRGATLDVADRMVQLLEVLVVTPAQRLPFGPPVGAPPSFPGLQGNTYLKALLWVLPSGNSPENSHLISYNSVWEACQQVPHVPRDNKAAALLMLTKSVDFVKDAHEEIEQAVEECDPYSGLLNDSEDSSGDSSDVDDELGFPSIRDVCWSEADRELMIPCLALVRASRACLKKIRVLVAENGKKDQVAQLDDIVVASDEISPSVDDLALSMYPPVCRPAVRISAAKLVSVLRKALEVTKASHVNPQPEDSWIPVLFHAVDHCMDRIKELTQSEIEL